MSNWMFKEDAYKRRPLPRGERVLAVYPVTIGRSRLTQAGAEMVITERHLILNPMDWDKLKTAIRAMGALGATGIGLLAGAYERIELARPLLIHAADVWETEPIERSPPGIMVTLATAETLDISVFHRMSALIWDKRNRQARNHAGRLLESITKPYG